MAANPIEADFFQSPDVFAIPGYIGGRRAGQREVGAVADSTQIDRATIEAQTRARCGQSTKSERLPAYVKANVAGVQADFKLVEVWLAVRPWIEPENVRVPDGLFAGHRPRAAGDDLLCVRIEDRPLKLPHLGKVALQFDAPLELVSVGEYVKVGDSCRAGQTNRYGTEDPRTSPLPAANHTTQAVGTCIVDGNHQLVGLAKLQVRRQRHFPTRGVAHVMIDLALRSHTPRPPSQRGLLGA